MSKWATCSQFYKFIHFRLKERIADLERELVQNELEIRNVLVDEFDVRLRRKEAAVEDRMEKKFEVLKKHLQIEVNGINFACKSYFTRLRCSIATFRFYQIFKI